MEQIIREGKISVTCIIARIIIDICFIGLIIGLVWLVEDIVTFCTTKLTITNKKVTGKTGLINTNQLDSPLNKINGIRVKKQLFGHIFNYGTIIISTSSDSFDFKYISNPDEFRTTLNNQIEKFDDERIKKQAVELAEAMKAKEN